MSFSSATRRKSETERTGVESKLYVNAFWLGILLTLVGFVVVIIVMAIVASHKEAEAQKEDGMIMSEEEFREMIEASVRESAEKVLRERMYGGEVEDGKD